jgi:hypothetical protein
MASAVFCVVLYEKSYKRVGVCGYGGDFVRGIEQKSWRRPLLPWFCTKNRTKGLASFASGMVYKKFGPSSLDVVLYEVAP